MHPRRCMLLAAAVALTLCAMKVGLAQSPLGIEAGSIQNYVLCYRIAGLGDSSDDIGWVRLADVRWIVGDDYADDIVVLQLLNQNANGGEGAVWCYKVLINMQPENFDLFFPPPAHMERKVVYDSHYGDNWQACCCE